MDQIRIGRVKGIRIAVAAFAMSVFLFVAMAGGTVYLLTAKSNESTETHEAICALSSDLEQRTEGSRDFLRKHPNGAFGFSASSIRESVLNQERTIDALSIVNC